MDLINRPEHHANMQEASPTWGERLSSTSTESDSLPPVAELVRQARTPSAAPASPRRHIPVPRIIIGPWDLFGPVDRPVNRPGTITSFFRELLGEDKSDTSDQPEEQNS